MKRGRKPMGPISERICRVCKHLLSSDKFYAVPSRPGGRDYVCKECNTKLKEEAYIRQRLKKYGKGKILHEIEKLNAGIKLRIRILAEYGNHKEVKNETSCIGRNFNKRAD